MLEIGLIALATLATGGLIALARTRWQQQSFRKPTPQAQLEALERTQFRKPYLNLAQAGLYRFGTPSQLGSMQGFNHLHLEYGDLVLQDARTKHLLYFPLMSIQWVSAISLQPGDISELTIHLERNGIWHLLTLRLPQMEMGMLVKLLRQAVHPSRRNIGNAPQAPIGPIEAFYTEQTLQGETRLGQGIGLYLLPHLLVVLKGERVQAKLDLSSIRRVLAVERSMKTLDNVFKRHTPDGMIRLYSMSETVAFALVQYREMADEIGALSRCPVEHVYRDDKVNKI